MQAVLADADGVCGLCGVSVAPQKMTCGMQMMVLLRVSMGACNPLGVGNVFVMLVHNFWLTSWRPHSSGSLCQTRLLGLRLHVLLAMLSAITESRHRLLFSLAPLQSGVSQPVEPARL